MVVQDESEDDVGSSDEDDHRMAKPVFVLKADRETVLEKERAELEAMQLKEAEQKRLESRVVRGCPAFHLHESHSLSFRTHRS